MELKIFFAGEKTGSIMIRSLTPPLRTNLARGLNFAGLEIANAAKKGISQPAARGTNKAGRVIFFRNETDDLHVRSGHLRRSLGIDRANETNLTVKAGTNVAYGAYNEFGAPKIKLPARPWLSKAYKQVQEKILGIIKTQIMKPLGG